MRTSERQWQPMETAPRDGREVIIAVESRAGIRGRCLVGHYMPGGYCIEDHPPIEEGWYFWNGLFFDQASRPAAWMPLPEIPKFDGSTGQMVVAGVARPLDIPPPPMVRYPQPACCIRGPRLPPRAGSGAARQPWRGPYTGTLAGVQAQVSGRGAGCLLPP